MSNDTDTVARKRQTKKTIYDWHDLEAAITERRRLVKQTEISEQALKRAAQLSTENYAQMSERVIAYGADHCIRLAYLEKPKGADLSDARLTGSVKAYKCAGGRTTYKIDDSVNGWFANAHLPMSAGERTTRSQYRSEKWYYGQSGVYQKGTGPYYPDAGPDCENLSLEQAIQTIDEAVDTTAQWRELAAQLCQRVAALISPFRDVVVRYELEGADSVGRDRFLVGGFVPRNDEYDQECGLESLYGINIRLKSPHVALERGWELVPDFIVSLSGPVSAFEDGPQVMYGVTLGYPQGRHQMCQYRAYGKFSTGLPFAVSRSPVRILEAARQWAASRIYIPCA